MKRIPLTKGKYALVSNRFYRPLINIGRWQLHSEGYAVHNMADGQILMHREVLRLAGKNPGQQTDHKNRNRLDNRLCNLRPSTVSQNQHNRGHQINSTTKTKGVSKRSDGYGWAARIQVQGVAYYLGCFKTRALARLAYQRAVLQLL